MKTDLIFRSVGNLLSRRLLHSQHISVKAATAAWLHMELASDSFTMDDSANPVFLPPRHWDKSSYAKIGRKSTDQSSSRDSNPQLPSIKVIESDVERFIGTAYGVLSPPCFSWQPLRTFLEQADVKKLFYVSSQARKHCLFDRRYLTPGDRWSDRDESTQRHSNAITCDSRSSLHVDRAALDDHSLLQKLASLVSRAF